MRAGQLFLPMSLTNILIKNKSGIYFFFQFGEKLRVWISALKKFELAIILPILISVIIEMNLIVGVKFFKIIIISN